MRTKPSIDWKRISRDIPQIVAFLGIGFAAGFLFNHATPSALQHVIYTQTTGTSTSIAVLTDYTNPLLSCSPLTSAVPQTGLNQLQMDLQNYVAAQKSAGLLLQASIYYRDLNTGASISFGNSNIYVGASLLKVPLAMSFYKKAETEPEVLKQTEVYTPDLSITQDVQPYPPIENVVLGQSYSVADLIRIMLEQSSNEAAGMLFSELSPNDVNAVYKDLNLPAPVTNQPYQLNVRQFASFLLTLYNATYLDRKDSSTILSYLAQASYTQGLVAGVPDSVPVAHKFGSHSIDDGTVELHDCGIIYVQQSPYILCIMTEGYDFPTLSETISHISGVVYQAATAP